MTLKASKPRLRSVSIRLWDGEFTAWFSAAGLAGLDFPGARQERQRTTVSEVPPGQIEKWARLTRAALEDALAGRAPRGLPPLDLTAGSRFQRRVWQAMLSIPPRPDTRLLGVGPGSGPTRRSPGGRQRLRGESHPGAGALPSSRATGRGLGRVLKRPALETAALAARGGCRLKAALRRLNSLKRLRRGAWRRSIWRAGRGNEHETACGFAGFGLRSRHLATRSVRQRHRVNDGNAHPQTGSPNENCCHSHSGSGAGPIPNARPG